MKTHIKSISSRIAASASILVTLLAFAGQCAAQNTEFRFQTVDENTIKVGFWNNAYYTKGRAQEIVFEKIATVALQQGAGYFELVNPQVSTDYVASADTNTSSTVLKTKINQPPRADREWSKSGTIIFPRYFFTTQVKLHKAPPAQPANKVYNAKNVVARRQRIEKPFKAIKRGAQDSSTSSRVAQSGNGAQSSTSEKVSDKVVEWTNQSYDHLQKGEWIEAIRTASAAINLNKNFDIPYVNRATAYIKHGYTEKAMMDIDTALALNPNSALAINMKGFLTQDKGNTEQALRFYTKACNKKLEIACTNFQELAGFRPDKPQEQADFYLQQSALAMEKNRWSEVIEWTTKAIEADPDNYKAYSNRAGALAELGRAKEALLDADQAIALNPDFGAGYHNRGHAYKVMGNTRDAALEFEIGCSLGVKASCAEFKNLSSVAKK